MIQNYLRIAWRNILKNGFYSAINVIGLMAGTLFSMLIGVYVWGEIQINRGLKHADRQYILTSIWKDPNHGSEITSPGPLCKRLQEQYPSLVSGYFRWDGITSGISIGDKHFREGIQIVDSTLFSMYGFELLYGDTRSALSEPYSVIITAEHALKFFGKTDVLGEALTIQSFSGEQRAFKITGVLKSLPENSVTQLIGDDPNSIFVPTNTRSYFGRADFESWQNASIVTYVELKEGVKPSDLEQPVQQLLRQNADPVMQANLTIRPVSLMDYYLEKNKGLAKRMLYALSSIGLFILLMAIINFNNLAISRSGTRIREMGVRKALGGQRSQLVFQFLAESILLVLTATMLSLAFYPLAKPLFEQMVGKSIPSFWQLPPVFASIPAILVVLLGLLAGLYPAFVLSSLKPVDSLKGKLTTVSENVLLRKYLLGFQFCVANVVIIAAIVVSQQVDYFLGQELGYNKTSIVSAQVPRDWTPQGARKMKTIRDEFDAMPQISRASLSYEIPNGNNGSQPWVYRVGEDSTRAVAMQALIADENYIETYQIPLKSGLYFDNRGLDSGMVVLNEKAVRALGFENAASAVGTRLRIPNDPTVFTIKGVTNDFHFGSMQQAIQPMVFFSIDGAPLYRYLSFKVEPEHLSQNMATIQQKWAELMPGSAFKYAFMDETLTRLYQSEVQLKKAGFTATVLALIIALLGVLGLVSMSIQKRVKEMGVRKVLGASVPNIIGLFIKEFMIILAISALAGCPIAYYLMQNWLNNYAYHIDLAPKLFLFSVAGMGITTLLLIGLQTLKVSIMSPVRSLRSE